MDRRNVRDVMFLVAGTSRTERITRNEAQEALMAGDNATIKNGQVWGATVKSVGAGIYELRMVPTSELRKDQS